MPGPPSYCPHCQHQFTRQEAQRMYMQPEILTVGTVLPHHKSRRQKGVSLW